VAFAVRTFPFISFEHGTLCFRPGAANAIRALPFDLDGTLVDSVYAHVLVL
jgi:hypothetical protein